MQARVSIIAALGATTRAIGKNQDLLWHLPGDLPRFKRLTMGHPVIMGRKTYSSIGKPLPERTNIVITHASDWNPDQVVAVHSFIEALEKAHATGTDEVFVIGGGQVYAAALPYADRLYLTLVDDETPGDTYFPAYEQLPFSVTEESVVPKTAEHPSFRFVILERTTP